MGITLSTSLSSASLHPLTRQNPVCQYIRATMLFTPRTDVVALFYRQTEYFATILCHCKTRLCATILIPKLLIIIRGQL